MLGFGGRKNVIVDKKERERIFSKNEAQQITWYWINNGCPEWPPCVTDVCKAYLKSIEEGVNGDEKV
jgi:hypothetical protein